MANRVASKKNGKGKGAAAADDVFDDEDASGGAGELPSGDVIKQVVNDCAEIDSRMATLRGQKGSAIKSAEADHNVHRGALREALKQLKMTPEAREEYQRHLESYVLQLGIGRQANLFDAPAHPPSAPAPM